MVATEYLLYTRLLAPVCLVWMAWIVAKAPYRERFSRLLVVLLVVLATGFLMEFAGTLMQASAFGRAVARAAFVPGVVDPLLLLAVALAAARPDERLPWRRALAPLAAAAGAMAFVFVASPATWNEWNPWSSIAHLVYVNGLYLAAFIVLMRAHQGETRRYRVHQLSVLAIGIGFVALSRMSAFVWPGVPGWIPYPSGPTPRITTSYQSLLAVLATLAIVWVAFTLRRGARQARPHRIMAWTFVLIVAFFAVWLLAALGDLALEINILWTGYFGLRWIVFSVFMVHAVLRYQLFDYELHVRNLGVFFFSLVTALAVALAAAAFVGTRAGDLLAGHLAGLAAGAAAFGATYVASTRLLQASAASPTIAKSDARRLEIYEATLELALRRPAASREELIYVETLREVFEISPEEHENVLARLGRAPADAAGTPRPSA